MEANAMQQPPRPYNTTFFNFRELALSIIQGLIVSLAVLTVYQYGVYQGYNEAAIRTLVFLVLVTANILLTLVNRSLYYSLRTTLQYKNKLIPFIIAATIALVMVITGIPSVRSFFGLTIISVSDFCWSVLLGALSVIWLEGWKWLRRCRSDGDRY